MNLISFIVFQYILAFLFSDHPISNERRVGIEYGVAKCFLPLGSYLSCCRPKVERQRMITNTALQGQGWINTALFCQIIYFMFIYINKMYCIYLSKL